MHSIKVRIKADGTTEVAVDGLAGASCKDVTRALEKALGKVTSDKQTAEFHKTAVVTTQVSQGGGS